MDRGSVGSPAVARPHLGPCSFQPGLNGRHGLPHLPSTGSDPLDRRRRDIRLRLETFVREERRLAARTLALGATGSAAAQQEGGGGETETGANPFDDGDGGGEAIVQVSTFYPDARFTFVSWVIDWTPNVPAVSDDVWDSYDTYNIRWLNTDGIVPLWVEQDATLGEYDEGLGYIPDDQDPNRPQLYEMDQEWELFDEGNDLVEATFSTVPEQEEEQILANDDWRQDEDVGNGTPTETGTATGTETPTDAGS